MKIGIVGAGAMGSVYAALLAGAGNEVWVLDVWRAHIEAIRAHGLRVQGASGDRTVHPHATLDARDAGPCDLVVISTKAADIEAAAANGAPMIGPQTMILTIQNGLGSAERLGALVGPERLLVGIAGGFGASIVGPGHAHHNGWEIIRLGPAAGGVTEDVRRVAAVWREAGFRVEVAADIHAMIWGKLICNIAYSATCTVTGLRIGEVPRNPGAWAVARQCVLETCEVARAKGIPLPSADPIAYVRDFSEKIPNAQPSMLLDLLAGRRTEIDALNGAVVREAEAIGLAAPVNRVMRDLVKALEEKVCAPSASRGGGIGTGQQSRTEDL